MAPTILHVGAIQDRQADYIRRALRPLVSSITAQIWSRTWHGCGTEVITPRESGSRQCASRPSADALNCQRLARLDVPNDLIDLGAIQRALYAQDGGQHDHCVAIASNHARRHRSAR